MARARAIFVVTRDDWDDAPVAFFTVKHEAETWVRRMPSRWAIWRCPVNGEKAALWSSGRLVAKGGEHE